MFDAASFLLGVFTAFVAVLIYWMTVGRFHHQPLAEERYKAALQILVEILQAQQTGNVKEITKSVSSSAFVLSAPVVDVLLRLADRPPEPLSQELTDLVCEIVATVRKDLGLLPIEKDKIARLLRFNAKLGEIKR